jgi:hypothetical protein
LKALKTLFIYLSLILTAQAGGSIDPNNQQIKSVVQSSPSMSILINNGVVLRDCVGIRLGSYWTYLSGRRIGPYTCHAEFSNNKFTVLLKTNIQFFDDKGTGITQHIEDQATTFKERLESFTIYEEK